ncbi:MAG: HAMP domain-containing histidine kinase [Verrucomicrobia bacterium]|nr:HAMP domain-containing histidine kinase [Verrucomicrobiota bacterium]
MEQKVSPTNIQADSYTADYYASLLVGLIHKLNNVITVLTGNSGLLLLEPDLKADVAQPVQQMARAAELLSRCLNEAASMSKVTPLCPELVTLSELFQAVICPSGIFVVKKYDEQMKVQVDRRKLKEILEQILRNAGEASARTVVVAAQSHPRWVDLKLRDDGHGMKPEVMRRAFDPFFTTRRQREQFGLGLFKARGDLARMKARIFAESDGKSYTEIVVQLPSE